MHFIKSIIIFGWLFSFAFLSVTTSAQSQVLLLPPQYLTINPTSGSQSNFGLTDFDLSISGFTLLQNGAKCNMQIQQARDDGSAAVTNVDQTYTNGNCKMILPADNQISNELSITLRVTNTDQKIYGLDFKYFFTSGSDLFIDTNQYQLPDSSLYIRPEISITVKDKDLKVGQTTTVQYSFKNIDSFAIKDFQLESNLSQNAKIICDSFSFTDRPLDGFTVFNSLSMMKVFAQDGDSATCEDGLKFKATIKDIKVGEVTRLNFDIEVTATGELSFNVLTNLDQGNIAYESEPIAIIDNFTNSKNDSNIFMQNPAVFYSFTAIVISILAAGIGYYFWRKKRIQNSL
jgi:hypothetical protein